MLKSFLAVAVGILIGLSYTQSSDYQINVNSDMKYSVWDGPRKVGEAPASKLDSLIINDNK